MRAGSVPWGEGALWDAPSPLWVPSSGAVAPSSPSLGAAAPLRTLL